MNGDRPDGRKFWKDKRVVVTGGAGFLGSFVVKKLRQRADAEVFVPRSREYDLRDLQAVRRMLAEARPHVVIHLAARVGGIGANMAHPAESFYDNLMMGAQGKRTSGTATPRRRTPLTVWRRRCCWCSPRLIAPSTGSIASSCCR